MAFIPGPPSITSARASELARRITDVIEAFHREHPDTSAFEVRQAVRLALSTGRLGRQRFLFAAIGGLAALGVFLLAYLQHPPRGSGSTPTVALTIGAAVVLLALILANRNR